MLENDYRFMSSKVIWWSGIIYTVALCVMDILICLSVSSLFLTLLKICRGLEEY